jgi:hypothetical protein
MTELEEYREHLLERLEQAVLELRQACEASKDPSQPARTGEWNVHQRAAHTRDVDRDAYGLRVRRTLAEEEPLLANYDSDSWLEKVYRPDEPIGQILDELTASIGEQIRLLRSMPEAGWSRTSRHERLGGGLTLQLWVERGLAHIEEHLATIKAAPA